MALLFASAIPGLSLAGGTTTTTVTIVPECGDGAVSGDEICDDGDLEAGDGCDAGCLVEPGWACPFPGLDCVPVCGDSMIVGTEPCDDGNADNCDACSNDCGNVTGCGDGEACAPEACDDGNLAGGDGCSAACTVEACGNGTVDVGEECDDAGETVDCDTNCTGASCGDGVRNETRGETCDDGNLAPDDGCSPSCRSCTYSIATMRAMTAFEDNVWGSAWSPDGKRIAFSRQRPFASPLGDLWVVRTDDPLAPLVQITTTGQAAVFNLAWSEDQSHVLYDAGACIERVRSDGSGSPEVVTCAGLNPNVNYETSRLFYSAGYSAIGSVAVDASGAPLPGTEVVLASGLGPAMVQPTVSPDGDRLVFARVATGPNLACIVYRLDGVLDILSGVSPPVASLADPRISVLVDQGTFINTPQISLTGELVYLAGGTPGTTDFFGDNFSGALFPGEDLGTDAYAFDPTDENTNLVLDEPSSGENNGVLDPGEDVGLDGAPLDPFDNGSGASSMISDNDGVTGEPSKGEGNGVLDVGVSVGTNVHTVVTRMDGTSEPQILGGGFLIGVSPDGTQLSFTKRTWEGPLGTSKPFLNWDLFIGSVRTTCPITAADGGVVVDGSGTRLEITPGAIASDTDISIETPPVDLVPTTPMPLALARIYGPSGLVFSPPASLRFRYTDAQITGFDESTLSLNVYDSTTESWQSLATDVDEANDVLTAEVPHFSPVAAWGALTCGNGELAGEEECDDGNTVSGDGCTAACLLECTSTPRDDCRVAGKSRIVVIDDPDSNTKDAVKWKWGKGATTLVSGISDPTGSASYRLCFYPDGALAAEGSLPPGERWQSHDEKGYRYKDPDSIDSGVSSLRIVTGDAGRSSVSLKAKGVNVPDGLLPASSFSVQMNDPNGTCWGSGFASGDVKPGSFKATSP